MAGHEGATVTLPVGDAGPGVPEAEREAIFDSRSSRPDFLDEVGALCVTVVLARAPAAPELEE